MSGEVIFRADRRSGREIWALFLSFRPVHLWADFEAARGTSFRGHAACSIDTYASLSFFLMTSSEDRRDAGRRASHPYNCQKTIAATKAACFSNFFLFFF